MSRPKRLQLLKVAQDFASRFELIVDFPAAGGISIQLRPLAKSLPRKNERA